VRALVADDDAELVDLLSYGLSRDGYVVSAAVDGQQAIRRWRSENPDIVILDINLPKINGFNVCRLIREKSSTPVIMLTARTSEADIVRAFRLGADDYIVKPFSPKQLRVRIEAILRRCKGESAPQLTGELRVGNLTMNWQTYDAVCAGKAVHLSRVEFRILYMLAANMGRIVPYSRLFEYAWGYDADGYGREAELLKAHISQVRDKLGLRNDDRGSISNVRRVGYMFSMPGALEPASKGNGNAHIPVPKKGRGRLETPPLVELARF